jgi:multidrug efflux pump subunit AcrA (membrane-fusion protein)
VLTATSTRRTVTISLDAAAQTEVKVGDAVSVQLPQGSTTPGVVSAVGRVAAGSGSSVTIPVYVSLRHPSVAGSLDQAPVTVEITVGTVHDVLVVPVAALLAQPAGGYAVETAGVGGVRRLVPVTVGVFDDADGLVQVSGRLVPGQRVVVPAT